MSMLSSNLASICELRNIFRCNSLHSSGYANAMTRSAFNHTRVLQPNAFSACDTDCSAFVFTASGSPSAKNGPSLATRPTPHNRPGWLRGIA